MSRKDYKKKKQNSKRKEESPGFHNHFESDLSREKTRARQLRKSSWWRKKCSSGICYYCNQTFKPDSLTMDHLIPISRGGKSEKINLVPACKDCNNNKKYLLPSEWKEYLLMIKNMKK